MGLRSWFTRVEAPGDWDFLKKAICINPLADGVTYIIDITEDTPVFSKAIWVAWSGDTNWSLIKYMPVMFKDRTLYLDAVLGKFPAFHQGNGPEDYGTYLEDDEVERVLEERWQPGIEDSRLQGGPQQGGTRGGIEGIKKGRDRMNDTRGPLHGMLVGEEV